jgi:hypothetical protein
MQLHPVPKCINLVLSDKMPGGQLFMWIPALIAPSGGIEMCTHAAYVMQFQHGNCPMPKHLTLCVSLVVIDSVWRGGYGWAGGIACNCCSMPST